MMVFEYKEQKAATEFISAGNWAHWPPSGLNHSSFGKNLPAWRSLMLTVRKHVFLAD
jgi:hypothetical protein